MCGDVVSPRMALQVEGSQPRGRGRLQFKREVLPDQGQEGQHHESHWGCGNGNMHINIALYFLLRTFTLLGETYHRSSA